MWPVISLCVVGSPAPFVDWLVGHTFRFSLINSDAVLVTKNVAAEKCFWGNDWILMDCNIAHWLTPHGIFHLMVYQSCPLRHLVRWCNIAVADMIDATRTHCAENYSGKTQWRKAKEI